MPTFLSPLTVVVINKSTVVTDAAVSRYAAAQAKQLNGDFAPFWEVDGVVTAAKTAPAGALPVYILDDSDQAGALGYHDNDPRLGPFGRVFARTDQRLGLNWTVTASHEVLELVADPFVFAAAQVNTSTFTALEVCDAVEADQDGYQIDGVTLSDFLTPAWFATGYPGPYDFRRLLTRPFQLRRGGYASVKRCGEGWTQVTAQEIPGVPSRARYAHRRLAKAVEHDQAGIHDVDITEQVDGG